MTRAPLVLVAVLAATGLTAAALKWRALRARPRAVAAAIAPVAASSAGAVHRGIGGGVPAVPAGDHGARMLHGDARRTARAAGHAPRARPSAAWTRDVGGPVEAQVVTSPDGQTLYVASLGGALTALARADGAVRWTYAFGDRAYATPCVGDDGTIYAGSDGGKVVALTPEGKVRWSLDTEGEADSGLALAPDGTVVFAAGRRVFGVSPQGWLEWRFAAKRKVFTAPAIAAGGRVFFGSQDHHAYGLTPQGGILWSVDLGADVDGGPAIGDDGGVFFGTDGDEVVRVDPEGGRVVWRARVGGDVRGSLSLARDGAVLAGVFGPAPRVVRLRAADGAVLGDFPVQGTGAREFGIVGGPLEDGEGTLLFGAQDDAVRAVGPDGQLRWSYATGADVDAPVTLLEDGALVVGSDDGKVTVLAGERP